MDRSLSDSKLDWTGLLSLSNAYERNAGFPRSEFKRSFELWRLLAEITKKNAPRNSAPSTFPLSNDFQKHPAQGSIAKPEPKKASSLQQSLANRVQKEREMLKALVQARTSGSAAALFRRDPGKTTSIIKNKSTPKDSEGCST
ncbi:MAG: hypothetical protein HYX41_00980 [Bdellovibrio sp.]|nr:hypothetical protein [Bdellovibrio sp.]